MLLSAKKSSAWATVLRKSRGLLGVGESPRFACQEKRVNLRVLTISRAVPRKLSRTALSDAGLGAVTTVVGDGALGHPPGAPMIV